MISLNKIYALSGEDYLVVQDAETDDTAKMVLKNCGIFVLLTLFLSWIGGIGFFVIVFHQSYFLSAIIGILWAFVITNLYVLLLSTISPIVITKRMTFSEKKQFVMSNGIDYGRSEIIAITIRVLFMALFAIINGVLFYLAIFEINNRGVNLKITEEIKEGFSKNLLPMLTILAISLYCYIRPILIKHRLRFDSNYYQIKKKIYEGMVKQHYENVMKPNFIHHINSIYKNFQVNINTEIINRTAAYIDVPASAQVVKNAAIFTEINVTEFVNIHSPREYFEAFEDAPFNTIPQKKSSIVSNAKFETITSMLYKNDEDENNTQFDYFTTKIEEIKK
jgi:hypothetical protein